MERVAKRGTGGLLVTRDELLAAAEAAVHDKSINVAAIKLLLEEHRRDEDGKGGSEFDDLDDGPANVVQFRSAS